jgi:hypothetical protein
LGNAQPFNLRNLRSTDRNVQLQQAIQQIRIQSYALQP